MDLVAFETSKKWEFLRDQLKTNLMYFGVPYIGFFLNGQLVENGQRWIWLSDNSTIYVNDAAWQFEEPLGLFDQNALANVHDIEQFNSRMNALAAFIFEDDEIYDNDGWQRVYRTNYTIGRPLQGPC